MAGLLCHWLLWPLTFDLHTLKSNLGCILIPCTFISNFIKICQTLLKLDAACKCRLAWWCRYTVGLRLHHVWEREREVWGVLKSSEKFYSPEKFYSSPENYMLRKITNSPFQDYTPPRKITESESFSGLLKPLSLSLTHGATANLLYY